MKKTAKTRIGSIDILRGIVMVLMALDHTRDYFQIDPFGINNPTELSTTTPILFFTRWITHFCAPVFVFLTGISAHLVGQKKKNKSQLFVFLVTRGIWLIFLELTVVGFGWNFDIHFRTNFLQVIWAIGWGMIVLGVVQFFSKQVVFVIGFSLVFLHNTLDTLTISGGIGEIIWLILHQGPDQFTIGNHVFWVNYPVLPWVGLMLMGYCCGTFYQEQHSQHKRKTYWLLFGTVSIVLFIVLRGINHYGDPSNWSEQESIILTIISFLNTTKYPPSLLYILMTMGPSFILLFLLEGKNYKMLKPFNDFGRVPLFYYIIHLYLIHALAILAVLLQGYSWEQIDFVRYFGGLPPGYGFELFVVYIVWILVNLLLYPFCSMYNQYKSKNRSWWLSYL